MHRPALLRWLPLLLLASSTTWAQPFLDWKGLDPGPHAVGFRAMAATDVTRSFQSPTDYDGRRRPEFGNRPVQISIWYPAEAKARAGRMTYGDYVALLAWELGPVKRGVEDRRAADSRFLGVEAPRATPEVQAAFEMLYREPVLARRDAKPAAGRFPVLIYAAGQGYPGFDNSVMAEYLASHGFVVLASPSVGPDGRDMPDNPLAIDAQSRDMEFLAGVAQSLPQADPNRMAAMGFSLGGASAALFTLRNTRIKALISLDGVLRDDRYLPQLKGFPQFQPERLRGALLWIACGAATSLPGFGDGAFLEQAKYAEVVTAVFPGLHHHDLSSMSSLQRRRARGPTQDWSAAAAGYEAVSRLVLGFLDSRLNGVARTLDAEPEAVCRVTTRPARRAPPTSTDVCEAARKEGIAKASELVRIVAREAPDTLASLEEPLILLGYEALGAADEKLAIGVFALAEETFPASIDASYGLGKVYQGQGALEQAELHYRAAREKLVKDSRVPAEQKAGILGRIDKLLQEIHAED